MVPRFGFGSALIASVIVASVHAASPHADSASPTPPAGWQALRDYYGQCEISVPPDWQVTKGIRAGAEKNGTKYHLALAPALPKIKREFVAQRDSMKHQWSTSASFTIIEESNTRAIYRFENAGRYQWEVISAGAPNCMAALNSEQQNDSVVLQIARSLHHVN